MADSKIKELFASENTVYIFDVDGVLTPLEFGEYTHFALNDEEWQVALKEKDYYAECKPISVMQNFVEQKNKANIYVATRVMNELELAQKKRFLEKYYHILSKHIFSVSKNEEKLEVIRRIQKQYPNLEDKYFVMIDDTVDILNHIMTYSKFSTVHISSFLE